MTRKTKLDSKAKVEITTRWNAGEPLEEIATHFGVHKETARQYVRQTLRVETPKGWVGKGRVLHRQPRKRKEKSRPAFKFPDNPSPLEVPLELEWSELRRFSSKVLEPNESGCSLWGGALDSKGYGLFATLRNQADKAHRVAWRMVYGHIPPGMNINHRCDVPPCVEPTHLWLGTQAENMADMAAKGRSRIGRHDGQKGEDNVTAKLSWERVRAIRQLRETQGLTLAQIAKRFKISISQASNITSYKQWVESH